MTKLQREITDRILPNILLVFLFLLIVYSLSMFSYGTTSAFKSPILLRAVTHSADLRI